MLSRPFVIVIELVLVAMVVAGVVGGDSGADPLVIAPFVVLVVGFPAVFVLLMLAAYVYGRVSAARSFPPGTRISAALGPDSLVTEGPLGRASVRLGTYRRVSVRRHLVALENRKTKVLTVYPRELFPEAFLDELVERIQVATPVAADEPADATPDAVALAPPTGTTWFRTDPGFVARMATAYFGEVTVSPARIGMLAAIVGGASVLVVVITGGEAESVVGGLVVAGLLSLLMVWSTWRRHVTVTRQLTRQIPVGFVYRAALGPHTLWLDGPGGTAETRLFAYRAVSVRGEFVFLRARRGGSYTILPIQLFPGGLLSGLRDGVIAAGSTTSARTAPTPSSTR